MKVNNVGTEIVEDSLKRAYNIARTKEPVGCFQLIHQPSREGDFGSKITGRITG